MTGAHTYSYVYASAVISLDHVGTKSFQDWELGGALEWGKRCEIEVNSKQAKEFQNEYVSLTL